MKCAFCGSGMPEGATLYRQSETVWLCESHAPPPPDDLAEIVAIIQSVGNPKVDYVKSQRQTRRHGCHWPGCPVQVPPAMWGCRAHWLRLPAGLRNQIWNTYTPGQEVSMTPSREYVDAAEAVQAWIKANG